jgi:cytochrome c oxidase cbb3-type subunit 3
MRSSHRRKSGLAAAVLLALALGACRARERQGAAATGGDTSSSVSNAAGVESVALRPFHGDPRQARVGRTTFIEYNCYGCHGGLAGGGMGPSLRDTVWKYGGTDTAIQMSIRDGRPMGMPAWKPMLADSQIRNLVTYIRSLRTSAEPKFFFIGQAGAEGADTTRPATSE